MPHQEALLNHLARHCAAYARETREVLRSEGPAAARIAVTVVAAWQTAVWLGADQPPVFAAIVPLVTLRGDPMTAWGNSLQRVLGVMAGVVLGLVVLNVLRPSTAALAMVMVFSLGVGLFLRAGSGLNTQVATSSLLVFASTSPDAYALHRVWETAAGAGVTILLAPLLWPPNPKRILSALAADCVARLTEALIATAAAVGTGPATAVNLLALVKAHTEVVHANAARAREAERAMRFNPLRCRHRDAVRYLSRGIQTADQLTAHLSALAREVSAFSGRADLAPQLARAQQHLPALAAATSDIIEASLSAKDARPELARARDSLAAYARADSRPAAVALRRPFQRMLEDLAP